MPKFELDRFKYTRMENYLFNLLPADGSKTNSAAMAAVRTKEGNGWDVNFPLKNVTTVMNLLIRKTNANDEVFEIRKDGKRPGHSEVEYWVETRTKEVRKPVGRPPTGPGKPMVVRMQPNEIAALDRWIDNCEITRPEAIRQLVNWALEQARAQEEK